MSLVEVSPNFHHNSISSQRDSKWLQERHEAISHAIPPPLAVRNMLKDTTETGAVGIFAKRPRRVTHSATQSSTKSCSQTSTSSIVLPRGQHRHRLDNDAYDVERLAGSSSQALRPNDSFGPQAILHQNHSYARRKRSRNHPYLHQSLHPPQIVPHQRILRSQHSLHSLGSVSAVSTLPSRYYRPHEISRGPSPATSNLYEYRYPSRSVASRHGSFRTDPPSPTSIVLRGRSIRDHSKKHLANGISFQSKSPQIPKSRHRQRVRASNQSRDAAIISAVNQNDRAASTISLASFPDSATDSIVPFYYDYSESFHGREALFPTQEHPAIVESASDEDIHHKSKGVLGTAAERASVSLSDSHFNHTELLTKYSRCSSNELARHSREASSRSTRSVLALSHQPIQEDIHREQDCCPLANEPVTEVRNFSSKLVFTSLTMFQSDFGSPFQVVDLSEPVSACNSTNSLRNWQSPSASTFFTNASRSPRNLSDLAARAHSPGTNAQHCNNIDAVTASSTPRNNTASDSMQEVAVSSQYQLPSLKFQPLSMRVSPTLRPLTSPSYIIREKSDIVSPKPERPTSSQSRKRFSKILDIDNGKEDIDSQHLAKQATIKLFTKLDAVEEDPNLAKTPFQSSPSVISTSGKVGKQALRSSGCPSSRKRLSGVTSHDQSTVESLLERHIECLGLKPEVVDTFDPAICKGDSDSFKQDQDVSRSEPPSIGKPCDGNTSANIVTLCSPTSLTSSDHKRLIPERLFANTKDGARTNFPLASSESDATFSLSWTDDKVRPSYGWLTLPSESNLNLEAGNRRQTLTSGEYADVESNQTDRSCKQRKQSNTDLTRFSRLKTQATQSANRSNDKLPISNGLSEEEPFLRSKSERRRKIRIHLKAGSRVADKPTSDEWTSTDARTTQTVTETRELGCFSAPVSAIDGFAELSGESVTASQKSLTSMINAPFEHAPQSWSSIAIALPIPPKRPTIGGHMNSVRTVDSDRSKKGVVEPINSCRTGVQRRSRELHSQDVIPQLAHPDLGPVMRASQFDLSLECERMAQSYKKSSFYEPNELLQPQPERRRRNRMRTRARFHSFRQFMPPSIRSFTFSPPSSHIHQRLPTNQVFRVDHNRPLGEQPEFAETVATSDFTYHKHKLVRKLKEWCRKRCTPTSLATRRNSVPPGGFIV